MSEIGTPQRPARVAIIGSGPAGFFAADHLLKQKEPRVSVDVYDRLPTPFGLVRLGVAPDHPKIKAVSKTFERVAENEWFRFFGNVNFGEHIQLEDLKRFYHGIIFTTGAQSDRRLNIPGEDLTGSHSATEFVAWYNGHPYYQGREFDLSQERVAIIGVGNVALDVARMLCRTPAELAATDVADSALEAFRKSRVKEVHLIGRRGPAQAAFTLPELQELTKLQDVAVQATEDEVELDPATRKLLEQNPDKTIEKKLEILKGFTGQTPDPQLSKRLNLRFLYSPVEILGDQDGKVRAIRVARNELYPKEDGRMGCRQTGEVEEWPVGLVFRSVGYRGVALPGVPFDDDKGVIRNVNGRILHPERNEPLPGLYVGGWIKRGPSGVIGTNKPDAVETVNCLLEDLTKGTTLSPPEPDPKAVDAFVAAHRPHYFSYEDWQRLDKLEVGEGKRSGRPRVKFTRIREMLDAIGRAHPEGVDPQRGERTPGG